VSRPLAVSAVLILLTTLLVALARHTPFARAAEPEKPLVPSIRDIMQQSHRSNNSHVGVIENELNKKNPDWTVIEARSLELVRVGKLLALNTPRKGSKESWEKLTALYTARATVLVDAAEQRDREEAVLQIDRFYDLCCNCHHAHR
jgi:hypothetical protein